MSEWCSSNMVLVKKLNSQPDVGDVGLEIDTEEEPHVVTPKIYECANPDCDNSITVGDKYYTLHKSYVRHLSGPPYHSTGVTLLGKLCEECYEELEAEK